MRTEDKIKVGIIGFGRRGILHAALVNVNPDVQIMGIYDSDETVLSVMRHLGFSDCFSPDLDALLDAHELDAVFLCTPNNTHPPLVKTLASRDLDIFVERPLAESFPSAKNMMEVAVKHPIIHALGYYSPFQRVFAEAKRLIDRNILGQVLRVRAYFYHSLEANGNEEGLFDKTGTGGGVVITSASDLFFLLHWYFGPLSSLFARASLGKDGLETSASVIMDFQSGLIGHADMSWGRPGYPYPTTQVVLEGRGGMMEISDDHIKLHLYRSKAQFEKGWTTIDKSDLPSTSWFYLEDEGLFEASSSFLRCCKDRTTPEVTWTEGLEVMRTVEAVYRSVNENRVIPLNEVQ